MKRIMIYGATGYTGSLISQKAKAYRLNIVLAGRDRSKLNDLARATGYDYIDFPLDNPENIKKSIIDIDYVVNIAGPFISGLPLLVQSCIECKKHFLDLAMDPNILAEYDQCAKKNDVMILSGIGAAFLPIDCLGGFLSEKITNATKLSVYVSDWNTISRGTAKSNIALIKYGINHRINGSLCKLKHMKYRKLLLNNRSTLFVPSSFGISTLTLSTNIPNIDSYFEVTPALKQFVFIIKYFSWFFGTPFMQKFLEKKMNSFPPGPNEDQMEMGRNEYYAEIENNDGKKLAATLVTPEAYKTTWLTTLKSLEIIDNYISPGFQTPYKLFGHEIIKTIAGIELAFLGEI